MVKLVTIKFRCLIQLELKNPSHFDYDICTKITHSLKKTCVAKKFAIIFPIWSFNEFITCKHETTFFICFTLS